MGALLSSGHHKNKLIFNQKIHSSKESKRNNSRHGQNNSRRKVIYLKYLESQFKVKNESRKDRGE